MRVAERPLFFLLCYSNTTLFHRKRVMELNKGNIFPYIGNKSCIADMIEDMTPPHKTYIEPCCGSAEIFFRKEPVQKEIINDYDSNIANFFRVLQCGEKLPYLIGHIFLSGNCEDIFKQNRILLRNTPNILDEIKETAEFIQSLSKDELDRAVAFYMNQVNSFSSTGSSYAIRGINIVPKLHRLTAAKTRLDCAAILNRDYRDVIVYFADEDTFIFLDPPYKGTEKMYPNTNFDEKSHAELFEFVYSIHLKFGGKCKIMITYNTHPLIVALAEKYGFFLTIRPRPHNMKNSSNPGEEFDEAIITNYDPKPIMDAKEQLRTQQYSQLTLFDNNGDHEKLLNERKIIICNQ